MENVIILGVVVAVVGATSLCVRARERRRRRGARWRVHTRSFANNRVRVQVEHYGEATQVITELDTADPEFDMKLWEAEARGEQLAGTLNASRTAR